MNTYLVFDGILTFLGVIMIAAAVMMKKTGRISELLLAEDERKRMRDEEGYIAYMTPRLIGFAAVCTLIGVFGILDDRKLLVIPYWGFIEMAVFLAAFLLFYNWMRKARRDFC